MQQHFRFKLNDFIRTFFVIEHLSELQQKHKLNVKNINIFAGTHTETQKPSAELPFPGQKPHPVGPFGISARNGGGPELPPESAKRKGTTKPRNTSAVSLGGE